MNLNKAFVLGRLTRDPETRTMPSGQLVASFGLATNRVWNDDQGQRQEKVEFHNIVAFRRLAEICSQYLKKGSLVLIEGRLQTSSWDDKQTGVRKYRTEIIAENMQMGPRSAGTQSPASKSVPVPSESSSSKTKDKVNEDDIPIEEPESQPASVQNSTGSSDEVKVEEIPF